jgi:hypothetical protein
VAVKHRLDDVAYDRLHSSQGQATAPPPSSRRGNVGEEPCFPACNEAARTLSRSSPATAWNASGSVPSGKGCLSTAVRGEISRYGAVFERTFIFDAFETDWLVDEAVL